LPLQNKSKPSIQKLKEKPILINETKETKEQRAPGA